MALKLFRARVGARFHLFVVWVIVPPSGVSLTCLDRIAGKEARVTVAIGDDADVGRDLGVPFDQPADRGGEAGRQSARGEDRDGLDGHGPDNAKVRPLRIGE